MEIHDVQVYEVQVDTNTHPLLAPGDMDLFALSRRVRRSASKETPKLWMNDGAGVFTDITLAAGLGYLGQEIHGVTIADVDGDGNIGEFLTWEGVMTAGEGHGFRVPMQT